MSQEFKLRVNGESRRVEVASARSLLSVLRDDLDLTGCKYGCGEGRCGACTVLIDGVATRSCVLTVEEVGGSEIRTIEGLERNGRLHPLQEAFLRAGALQCGYCTCGMILSAMALLQKNRTPSDEEIVRAMNGNMCRCGVYTRIMVAIREAAKVMKAEGP